MLIWSASPLSSLGKSGPRSSKMSPRDAPLGSTAARHAAARRHPLQPDVPTSPTRVASLAVAHVGTHAATHGARAGAGARAREVRTRAARTASCTVAARACPPPWPSRAPAGTASAG
eukprot:2139249-Prymnesium_polylepis.2